MFGIVGHAVQRAKVHSGPNYAGKPVHSSNYVAAYDFIGFYWWYLQPLRRATLQTLLHYKESGITPSW